MRCALIAVWGFTAAGCLSFNSMQTARTLGKGKFEVELEPSGVAVANAREPFGVQGNVSARGGVTEGIDLGGRVGMAGVQAEPKFSLTSPSSSVFHLSVAPSFTYNFLVGGDRLSHSTQFAALGAPFIVQLPLMIGFETGGGSEIVLSPRIAMPFAADEVQFLAGGSIGYRIQIGKVFRLHPEVGVLVPLHSGQSAPLIQAGLGFAFGN